MSRLVLLPILALAGLVVAQPLTPAVEPCSCPVVIQWNEIALRAIRSAGTPPPVAARNLAMLHVAVYDAIAATDPAYRPFRVRFASQVNADPDVTAAVAAHSVLTDLYPDRREYLDAALDEAMSHAPDGPRKETSVALGQEVAGRVLRWRAQDMCISATNTYTPRGGVGRWVQTPSAYKPPLLPGWAAVPCFALPAVADFRPPEPPAVGSTAYDTAYREVIAIGAKDSSIRTEDQTQVAHFWADGEGTITPPGHWNRIAQTVAHDHRLSTAEAARLFALLNVSMADAAIVCWDCKFMYDVWRPVTAARVSEPCWTPLLPTPPFPAYTSGHSSFSSAGATVLATFFGTDAVRFCSTSDELPGVTRSYSGFWAGAEEAGMSRIFGGIHWSFDNRAGLACGQHVGKYVAEHYFPAPVVATKMREVPVSFGVFRRERDK